MHSPVASVVVAALMLCPVAASAQQAKPDTVTQVNRQRVKAGMVAQYEAGRKKHMAWHKAQGDPWVWNVYEITTGPDTGAYLIASPGHSWADYDTWQAKMGEADAADAVAAMGGTQEGTVTSYWTQLNAISRMPPENEPPTPLLTLTVFEIKPGSDVAVMAAVSKINSALDAAKYAPRSVWYRLSTGGSPSYAVVSPRANMAALGASVPATLAGHVGQAQADALLKALFDNVVSVTSELLQRRADLSYAPQ